MSKWYKIYKLRLVICLFVVIFIIPYFILIILFPDINSRMLTWCLKPEYRIEMIS